MTETKLSSAIEFKRLTLNDKALYDSFLPDGNERGCEFSFANLYLWGEQQYAIKDGQLILLSRYGDYTVYPYPLGTGNKKAAIDAIIADSRARGIPCRISGMDESAKKNLEALYPGMFEYLLRDSSFDYVYDINDLAELAGKKYHGKRNHIYRFRDAHPDYTTEELSGKNITKVREMTEKWYKTRLEASPDSDFKLEHNALDNALRYYKELHMDGLVLIDGGEVLAVTLGSRLYGDIFDVQFEKARPDVNGAYAVINYEFARYLRNKYPEIRFLDREEDMGIEGLRKAKQSYHPHHRIEKYRAVLTEESHDD